MKRNLKNKRISSYEKIKFERDSLKSELMVLCNEPDSLAAIQIKCKYKMHGDIGKAMWAGNSKLN